jgi:DNA-directed RNA polymerase subunit RPC12/RpoP
MTETLDADDSEEFIGERMSIRELPLPSAIRYIPCPKCGKPLDYLIGHEALNNWTGDLTRDVELRMLPSGETAIKPVHPKSSDQWHLYSVPEEFGDKIQLQDTFRCPYCDQVVAETIQGANNILREPLS